MEVGLFTLNERYNIVVRQAKKEDLETGSEIAARTGMRLTGVKMKTANNNSGGGGAQYLAKKGIEEIRGTCAEIADKLNVTDGAIRTAVKTGHHIQKYWKITKLED